MLLRPNSDGSLSTGKLWLDRLGPVLDETAETWSPNPDPTLPIHVSLDDSVDVGWAEATFTIEDTNSWPLSGLMELQYRDDPRSWDLATGSVALTAACAGRRCRAWVHWNQPRAAADRVFVDAARRAPGSGVPATAANVVHHSDRLAVLSVASHQHALDGDVLSRSLRGRPPRDQRSPAISP